MSSLDAQARRAKACRDCGLCESRQQVVFGSGPAHASLMLIGEAPGRSEDAGGEPFIGRSGQLLLRLVEEEIGLGRPELYIANTVKCRPPNNRTPRAGELAACAPRLRAQVATLGPRLILAVGATAQRAVTQNTEAMRDVHGRVLPSLFAVPALVTYHPAAALRSGARIVEAMREDLANVAKLLRA